MVVVAPERRSRFCRHLAESCDFADRYKMDVDACRPESVDSVSMDAAARLRIPSTPAATMKSTPKVMKMRWLQNILFVACQVGLGCQSTGNKKPPAQKTAQPRDESTPFWAEQAAKGAPPATPVAVDGMLAGMLIDTSGRAMPNAVINITQADAGPSAKPIGIQADDNGYFTIKGLRSGTTYFLSVRADDGGKVLAGSAMTQASNTRMPGSA